MTKTHRDSNCLNTGNSVNKTKRENKKLIQFPNSLIMKKIKKIKWDVEKYKTDYESAEHWELRKKFMECHKANFAEDELVCLARVFTNIEFMGCR